MSIFFDASEIFQFTIRIEENGEKFYRHAVRITEDDDTKEIFDFLADEEINFGVKRELDSILYYHEIKFVPKSQHKLINKIIDEERKHFSKLTGLRKRYDRSERIEE